VAFNPIEFDPDLEKEFLKDLDMAIVDAPNISTLIDSIKFFSADTVRAHRDFYIALAD
jgi:adenylate cyclase class IV